MSQRAVDADLEARLGFVQTLRLVSVDPSRNRARVYVLTWQPTLWGEVALVRTWGRLDHPGRSQMTIYPNRNQARPDLRRLLRRRLQHGYEVVVCR
jgi:predicted DNA-binding WGR domain protein